MATLTAYLREGEARKEACPGHDIAEDEDGKEARLKDEAASTKKEDFTTPGEAIDRLLGNMMFQIKTNWFPTTDSSGHQLVRQGGAIEFY